MKRVIQTIVLLIVLLQYGFSQAPGNTTKRPHIFFRDSLYDFREIPGHKKVICNFQFINQGKLPLIISNVSSTCNCAVPAWTQKPVKKGRHGLIRISFNPISPGQFRKTIRVYSNANNSPVQIFITCFVNEQKNQEITTTKN